MKRNSFTLLETLISLIIVSIILSSLQILNVKDNAITNYNQLNTIENNYSKNKLITNTNEFKFVLHQ